MPRSPLLPSSQLITIPSFTILRTRQWLLLHRLFENLQRQLRRIIRHLMSGPKDPQKCKIVLLLKSSALFAVDAVWFQRLGMEGGGTGKFDGVGGRLVTEPVADEVGVAGPDDGLYA